MRFIVSLHSQSREHVNVIIHYDLMAAIQKAKQNLPQIEWHCTISLGNKVASPLPWTTVALRNTMIS